MFTPYSVFLARTKKKKKRQNQGADRRRSDENGGIPGEEGAGKKRPPFVEHDSLDLPLEIEAAKHPGMCKLMFAV